MKRFLTTLVVAATLVGCSSDDDKKATTNATVTLRDASGNPVNGISIYSYSEGKWAVSGDDGLFSDAEVITDANGVAKFENIEYLGAYLGSNQESFRFSAHYSKSGVNYKKVVAKTITKGESAVVTITVN